jgi:hypothetical protein
LLAPAYIFCLNRIVTLNEPCQICHTWYIRRTHLAVGTWHYHSPRHPMLCNATTAQRTVFRHSETLSSYGVHIWQWALVPTTATSCSTFLTMFCNATTAQRTTFRHSETVSSYNVPFLFYFVSFFLNGSNGKSEVKVFATHFPTHGDSMSFCFAFICS